jgi:hypothetical protein
MASALIGRSNNASEQMKATNKMNTKHMLARVRSSKSKALGILALAVVVLSNVDAATIVSNSFSYGYTKANASSLAWTLQAPTTQVTGDFTFTPSVTSIEFSSGGPIFPNRVLTSAGASQYSGNSGGVNPFAAVLNYSYTGTPIDAAPIPNYRISLIIDSISIYGVKYNTASFPGDTLAFSETTVGFLATSSTITLNNATPSTTTGLQNATPYLQLVWNPEDFMISGKSGARSFALVSESQRPIDGFEVFGRIELTYDAIPEPSTIALGAIGLTALLFFRKRRQVA